MRNHCLANSYARKFFWENLSVEIFYRWKIISSKTGLQEKMFWEQFFVENFLILRNNFMENEYASKTFLRNIIWWKIVCCSKIISSKTSSGHFWRENFFGRKIVLLQNNFLENRFARKTFLRKFFWSIFFFFLSQYNFVEDVWKKTILEKLFLVEIILLLQHHFPETKFARKKNWELFFV